MKKFLGIIFTMTLTLSLGLGMLSGTAFAGTGTGSKDTKYYDPIEIKTGFNVDAVMEDFSTRKTTVMLDNRLKTDQIYHEDSTGYFESDSWGNGLYSAGIYSSLYEKYLKNNSTVAGKQTEEIIKNKGLPINREILSTNSNTVGLYWVLNPYNGNNAAQLYRTTSKAVDATDSHRTTTMVFANTGVYASKMYVLCTAGATSNNTVKFQYQVHYMDGTDGTVGDVTFKDWGTSGADNAATEEYNRVAVNKSYTDPDANQRVKEGDFYYDFTNVYTSTTGTTTATTAFAQCEIATDKSKMVKSVTFTWLDNTTTSETTTNNQIITIFGITGKTNGLVIPEATAATETTATSFKANWKAVEGATGYVIDVSTDSTFTDPDKFVATNVDTKVTVESGKTSYSYTVNGIAASTTYYYRVRAVNGDGQSKNSNVIEVGYVNLDKNNNNATEGSVTCVRPTVNSAMPTISGTGSLPTMTGYDFAGYYDATTDGTQYYKADGTSAKAWDKTGNQTLYAHWTAKTSTVTLNGNGATKEGTTSVTGTYGQDMPALQAAGLPEKSGYDFAGYYDAKTGGTQYYNADGTSAKAWDKTAATTLYARWTAKTDTAYKVEHYIKDNGATTYSLKETENKAGTTDTTATATAKTYTGFTFDNDNTLNVESGTIAGDGSLVLKLYYSRNKYTVTWKNGDTQLELDENVEYETTPSYNGSDPTKSDAGGYSFTFDGWSTDASATTGTAVGNLPAVTADATYYAIFTKTAKTDTAYKVEHYTKDKGATTYSLKETENKAGTTDTTATATAKTYTGFTFDNGNTLNVKSGTIAGDGSLVLKLYYSRNKYTVTWKNGDTQLEKDENVEYETKPSYGGAAPTKSDAGGYSFTFDGWSTDASATTGTSVGNLPTVTADATYYAIFTKTAKTYKVTLDGNGATTPAGTTSVTGTYDQKLPDLESSELPKKNGYDFAGYYDAKEGGKQYIDKDGKGTTAWDKTKDTTLYVHWTLASYTITYDANSGTISSESQKYNIESNLTLEEPTRTGYDFSGWKVDQTSGSWTKDAVITTLEQGTGHYGNVKLIAQWTAKTSTVTLDGNGATTGGKTSVIGTYDSKLPDLESTDLPKRTGYDFDGYYDDATGGTQYIDKDGKGTTKWDKTDDDDMTLYVHWKAHEYTVKYDGNGHTSGATADSNHVYDVEKQLTANGYVRKVTVTYNQEIPALLTALLGSDSETTTESKNATFNGWAETKTGSVKYTDEQSVTNLTDEAEITLYAVWTNPTFVLKNPTKNGYDFNGWYSDKDLENFVGNAGDNYTPTDTQELYPKWTKSHYELTLNPGDGTWKKGYEVPSEYIYSDEMKLPDKDDISRPGYTFKGWYLDPQGEDGPYITIPKDMIGNKTFYAVWEQVVVEDITDVPKEMKAGTSLNLTGKIVPDDALSVDIEWEIADAGDTKATLDGNTLKAEKSGKVVVRAIIRNGLGEGKDFVKEFTIEVSSTENPKTADTNNLMLWITMLLTAFAGFGTTAVRRQRRRDS